MSSGIWIGIDRVDSLFAFYWSNDGKIWNKLGGASQLDFLPDALVGIEASQGPAASYWHASFIVSMARTVRISSSSIASASALSR